MVSEGEGKFALIQGDTVAGIWDTYEDAIKEGYQQFGLTKPFLVIGIGQRVRQLGLLLCQGRGSMSFTANN